MKVRKLFGIALLAGSLLLTSCDDLLNTFLGGGNKKSKEDETSEKQGYQGKQGATELSKEEWELAFSLEEFALRRNCHLQVTQDEREMNLDVDNGKFKIDVPTYAQYPFYMHFTGMSGDDIQGVQYYPNDDGTYSIHEDQEQLNLVMAEFGLIYLEYNSFTYDSSSKMYKADNYHYEVTYKGRTALSLDCEDCEVTIEDGFPKKLACTIVEGADGDRSGVHYEANYSRYNAINVELPNTGNGNGNNNQQQGNQGQTELSEKEWAFAFSLEETALRRNVKIECTQSQGTAGATMLSRLDNGKLELTQIYNGETSEPNYINFKSVSDGMVTYEVYGEGPNGMEAMSQTYPLDYIMSQIGVLEYKQKYFVYDKESRTYKADAFTETIVYENTVLSLVISDAEITIRDGLPYKVEFDFINNQASSDKIHMVTNYSDYGNITVKLPTVNSGGNNGGNANASFPTFKGTEISYEQFYNKFVERAKPGYQSVSITANMEVGGDRQTSTLSGNLVDGSWVIDGVDSEELSVESFIISEQMMTELGEEINDPNNNAEIKIYSDNDNPGCFVMTMSESALNPETGATMEVAIQYHLNQYFYATAQYVYADGEFVSTEIQWKY